jgi:hypothetical protein
MTRRRVMLNRRPGAVRRRWIYRILGFRTFPSTQKGLHEGGPKFLWLREAPVGIEPTNGGFADLCLTTWLRRRDVILACPASVHTLADEPKWASIRRERDTNQSSQPQGVGCSTTFGRPD